jgi:hypothetical protein
MNAYPSSPGCRSVRILHVIHGRCVDTQCRNTFGCDGIGRARRKKGRGRESILLGAAPSAEPL